MALQTFHGQIVAPNTGTLPVARTVTGIPFQPKLVLFYCACAASFNTALTGIMACFGAARTTGEQFTIAVSSDGSGTTSNGGRIARYGTECVCLPLNGTPAIDALATFVQFNADGFQVNFTDLAATAGMEVNYLALGGTDLTNVAISNVTPVSTTNGATQSVNFGFTPDCVITASPGVPSATGIADGMLNVGAAVRQPSSAYSALWYENDGTGNMDCLVYSTTQRAGAAANGTAIKNFDYSIQSWDATGVTLLWNDAPAATTARVYMIALKGGQYELENILAPTTTQTVSYGTAFQPSGLLAFGTTDATDTDTTVSTATVDSVMVMGACDSGIRQGAASIIQQDANASSFAKRQQSKTTFARWLTGTAASAASVATVPSGGLTGSGFDLSWSPAATGTRRFAVLAMGDTPSAPSSSMAMVI